MPLADLDPAYMGLGPVPAIKKVLSSTGMTMGDIDMVELNEAFAAQAIGCMRELNIDVEKPNELGSGVSPWTSHWMYRGPADGHPPFTR